MKQTIRTTIGSFINLLRSATADCQRCETAFPYSEREVYEIDLLDVAIPEPLAYLPAAA